MLVASLGLGWVALLADEYTQLGKHVAAGAGFVSNFVFWKEAGYFDTVAETKILQHLWSLSIEEQFYIVWPLVLWLASKRRRYLLFVTVLMAVISFGVNLKGVRNDASGTFYSPLARCWELLAGSLLAWGTLQRKTSSPEKPSFFSTKWFANILSWIGLMLLLTGFWGIHRELRFPGCWALIPVLGAILLIGAGPSAWLNRCVLSNRVLVWIGLISYPLYLWHWPLLSFARVIQGETPSVVVRLGAVAIATVLAWATYRWVETPMRTSKGWPMGKRIVLLLLMLGIGVWGYITYKKEGFPGRSSFAQISVHEKQVRRLTEDDPGSHDKCMKTYNLSGYIRFCNLSVTNKPHIALIGDSHARSLYYGLAPVLERREEGLLNIGGRLFLGVAVHPSNNDFEIKVYQGGIRATQFAVAEPSIDTVIMASVGLTAVLDRPNGVFQLLDHPEITDRTKIWEFAMRKTVDAFVQVNKKVIFLIDNPEIDFDPRSCFQNRPLPFMHQPRTPCAIRTSKYLEHNKEYRRIVFSVLKDYPTVKVFDAPAYLCDETWCWVRQGGNILYRDKDHLSQAGADLLARELIKVIDGAPSKILHP